MSKGKKGILLVNLGTPDDPSTPSVRRYLREFLMDGRVIDIPYINRWLLVNLIIATFRSPKSAKEYKRLWDERGSPLKYYGLELTDKVQQKLDEEYVVSFAMRYQNPSIQKGLDELRAQNVESILVIPLFPQYASASTGSVIDKVMDISSKWQVIPDIKFISKFFEEEKFIQTIVENAKPWIEKTDYDHYIFSYHGLPERQILKAEIKKCALGKCCDNYGPANAYCYRASCFETTRLITKQLGIKAENYTVAFQSRLGKTPWIKPYTDDKIVEFAEQGFKKVLALSPAFVTDCLETTVEVGETYKEMFIEHGGEQWDLVESLNVKDTWVDCLVDMIQKN